GEDQAVLRDLSLEGLKALGERVQIMPEPHSPHTRRRDGKRPLPQLVSDPHLTVSRLEQRELEHGLLDLAGDAVSGNRLPAADLLERQLTTSLVEVPETVIAIPRVPHHPARLADAAEHLSEVQQPQLVPDHLLIGSHPPALPREEQIL